MEEIDTQTEPSPEAAETPEAGEPEAGEQPAEFVAEESAAAEPEAREPQPAEPEPAEAEAAEPEPSEAEAADSEKAGPEPGPIAFAPPLSDAELQAVIEAFVYVAEEPLTIAQMANALAHPADRVEGILRRLIAEFEKAEHGIGIREVAGGFKMATKAEHHDAVRNFVKSLKPPLKLSLAALETLAVIAYKQPVTGPEIMQIRGVQGLGVLKTLLDRKLIVTAGRKNVIGKPVLYKTTKEFLIQFGLKDIGELPSLKEFEEIRRMAFGDEPAPQPDPAAEAAPDGTQETAPAAGAEPEAPQETPPVPAESETGDSETEG